MSVKKAVLDRRKAIDEGKNRPLAKTPKVEEQQNGEVQPKLKGVKINRRTAPPR